MLVETLFSQRAGSFSLKKISQRVWPRAETRLAFVAAAYNLLVSWGGSLAADQNGYVPLGVAEFVL
jgi:hypothetical protein